MKCLFYYLLSIYVSKMWITSDMWEHIIHRGWQSIITYSSVSHLPLFSNSQSITLSHIITHDIMINERKRKCFTKGIFLLVSFYLYPFTCILCLWIIMNEIKTNLKWRFSNHNQTSISIHPVISWHPSQTAYLITSTSVSGD